MKKLVIVLTLLFLLVTFFIVGEKLENNKSKDKPDGNDKVTEKRAMYISYLELNTYIKNKDSVDSKRNIITMLDNIKDLKFNMIILHVRPFSDAIYKSNIYPYSTTVSSEEGKNPGYDVLEYFIKEAHDRKIEIHAWINPYRIRNDTDTSKISKENPAYTYLNTNSVKVIKDVGIFYNPASVIVKELIVDGVRELVEDYDIDGIHFDDYFYPDKTIDNDNYKEYIENGGQLTLNDYRLDNILTMIQDVYNSIKIIRDDVLFGISPQGNIENNYNDMYLDVKRILANKGYVDYIMPQIYYGFFNEVKPFTETLRQWNELITVDTIKLIPALAFYKVGIEDKYAKSGSAEWINTSDIIKRQIIMSRGVENYDGFALFRYDYLFDEGKYSSTTIKEFNNMKSAL